MEVQEGVAVVIVDEQRDDPTAATSVPSTRIHVLQSQISALRDEILHRDSSYRQRRALLTQGVQEYDLQHQAENEIFHKKLSAMMDETEWHDKKFKSELSTLKDTWHNKFEGINILTEAAIERERQAREVAFQGIEDKLTDRDNQVEGLLDIISKQGEELIVAQQEREELKKEMKNVLVTLHIQFEHLINQGLEKAEELSKLKEEQIYSSEKFDRRMKDIASYVDAVQYEVNQVQNETKESLQKTTTEIASMRDDFELKIRHSYNCQNEEFLNQVQRQHNEMTNILAEVETLRQEKDKARDLQDITAQRFSELEDNLKHVKEVTTVVSCTVEGLNDSIQKESDEKLKEEEALTEQLHKQAEEIKETQNELTMLNVKFDDMKCGVDKAEKNWMKSYGVLAGQAREHEAELSSTVKEIAGLKGDLSIMEKQACSNLGNVTNQIQQHTEVQEAINANIEDKIEQHEVKWKTTELKIDQSSELVQDLVRKIRHQEDDHEAMKLNVMKDRVKQEGLLVEFQKKFEDWNSQFQGLVNLMQHRAEAQVLASKDFKVKKAELEQKVRSCGHQFDVLEHRVRHVEETMSNPRSIENVELMLQPLLKQQKRFGDTLKHQGEDVRKVKDDLKLAQKARDTVEQKVDTMNKTWESLFQHLVCQVKKDTADMLSKTTESESALKEVQLLVSGWERKFSQLSSEHSPSKRELATTFQEHRLKMDSLQTKLESCDKQLLCLADKLLEGMTTQRSEQTEENIEKWKAQFEKRTAEELTALVNKVDERTAKITIQTEVKFNKWSSALAKLIAQAQEDTLQLQKAVIDLAGANSGREKNILASAEEKVAQWNAQFESMVEQVENLLNELKMAKEQQSMFHSELEKKKSELSNVETQLIATNKSLKYECRGLRLQLRGLQGTLQHSQQNEELAVKESDPNVSVEERRE